MKKVNKVTESNTMISGHIDNLEGERLSGWAAVVGSNVSLKIAVQNEQGELLGSGVADIYREDLEKNGINEGAHGFSIEINGDLLSNSKSLVLIDADTCQKVNIPAFDVAKFKESFNVAIEHLVGNKLSFVVHNPLRHCNKTFVFKINQKVVATSAVNTTEKMFFGHVWLPAEYLNDKEHFVEISIYEDPFIYGYGVIKGNPVLTPWQYLKHSYTQPGLISKPASADKRYEALTFHLNQSDGNLPALTDITIAHRVLVEGYEGRKSFPSFNLPKVSSPKVSIIIPAFNKFALTYHCIASIVLAFNETSYEVILADDCSTDETSKAESIIGNLVISRNEENLRFLKSCNAAALRAKGDYIIFLNNDTEVSSYWIDELINQHEQDATVGLTGSKLINLDGTLQEAGGIIWGNGEPWNVGRNESPFAPEWNYVREVDYVTGAAMCITTTLWNELGGFSEEYAPCYYEDTDLSFKVREAGYKVLYVPHSEVIHFEGQSHGKDIKVGLKQYQKVNESTFKRKWINHFKSNVRPSRQALDTEKDRNVEQRILMIDYTTPMMGVDAGSYAAIQEIRLMRALGFKVTFVPDNLASMGKYTRILQNMGVEILTVPFYTSLNDVLARRLDEMDAVFITRYDIAQKYLKQIQSKGKPVLFNNADLHFLREIRAALAKGSQEDLDAALITKEQELKVCRDVDAVLTYNTTEHAVIASHNLQNDNLHVTPWVLDVKEPGPSFKQRKGIAFLGGYNHKPNVEAVEYMLENVMPLLKSARPDICFHIYGSQMPESFKKYAADNVIIEGYVESLDSVYREHRIFIAPLLSGAGIKGKVLDAMAYGTPTILTDVAAEGTGLSNGLNTLIANDPAEWEEAIIKLYDDEHLWNRFAENSRLLALENFSFENGVKRFKKIFESVGLYSSIND